MVDDIQEIAEIVELQTLAVPEVFGPPAPTEVIADPGFWTSLWSGYTIGLDWLFPVVMAIGTYVVLRHLIWNSLRFNYLHYLEYGEFVLLWGDDGNNHEKKDRRVAISKKLNCEADFVSWCASLLMSLTVLAIHAVIALAWPITIILVFPLALVRLVGYRKRRKIEFTQKLKGEHLAKEQQA